MEERAGVRSKKILVAYDDDIWRRSLTAFFHGIGYGVERAKVVSDLIRRVRNRGVQVMLMGDEIEEVKACDVIPLLKAIRPDIQVIIISSEESLDFLRRLRGAGIFYHAMRPIDLEEIRSAVECAFQKIEKEKCKTGFFSYLIPEMSPA
jgi:DNA-binding NtrC family response regulator